MLRLNEFKNAKDANLVFAKLFEARDFAHVAHLKTKSYAQHKALNGFYDDLLELTDSFIETYQGQYGLAKIEVSTVKDSEPVEYLEDFAKYMMEARNSMSKQDTHLHNILDEIVALTYQTIYKLKFLK